MRAMRLPMLVLALLGVSACSTLTKVPSQDDLERIPPAGYTFNKVLFEEYKQFAASHGGYDSWYFRKKADSVGFGDTPLPENPDQWGVSGAQHDEMMRDGAKLTLWLEDTHSIRVRAPEVAARAQAAYDCWVAEADGGKDSDRDSCRDAFRQAMTQLQPMMEPPESTYEVHFASGSTRLGRDDLATIRKVAAERKRTQIAAIQVVGFADATGPVAANQRLSEARADAVFDALVRAGVPEQNIGRISFGEARLPVPTPDGEANAQNRTVMIRFW